MSYPRWALALVPILLFVASGTSAAPVEVKAWLTAAPGEAVRVHVQAEVGRGWHTYSNTQAAGKPTKITLDTSNQYRQTGAFRANVRPKVQYDPTLGIIVHKYEGTVIWSAPIKLSPGVDTHFVVARGTIDMLICDAGGVCEPVAVAFRAVFQRPKAAEEFPTAFQQDPFDNILGKLGGIPGGDDGGKKLSVKASVLPAEGENPPRLVIEAIPAPGWYTYSITNPSGGSTRTEIKITAIDKAQLAGPFRPDKPPKKVKFNEKIDDEKHEGPVKWIAPLTLDAAAKAQDVAVLGVVHAQVCNTAGQCLAPQDYAFKVGDIKLTYGKYRAPQSHVEIGGYLSQKAAAPGDTVKLVITATPDARYHAYPVNKKPKSAYPTLIAVDQFPPGWEIGKPRPDKPPVEHDGDYYFEGPVAWSLEVKVPKNAKPGVYFLGGGVAYQVCQDTTCDEPTGTTFQVKVQVGSQPVMAQQPLGFLPSNYAVVEEKVIGAAALAERHRAKLVIDGVKNFLGMEMFSREELDKLTALDPSKLDIQRPKESLSTVALFLVFGFLGGLILNVMPCVLPVIGLKIMSFVQQGGESRGRIFALNVWFSLGLIFVFLVLAAFAAFAKLGWGEQFQEAWFTVVLGCVVFAFALALLGVWEVPIPGFVGTGAANELASKEGPAGAFTKGVLTTILATPCTGPFLGPALAWAVKQPHPIIFATFTAVGLGMASPFLLIGAFPKLVAFLPKPGVWMETFKQIMGFVLLATVVWLLSFLGPADVVPAISVMCGLGLAFWWIGRMPITATTARKYVVWGEAAVIIAGVCLLSYGWVDSVMEHRATRRFETRMLTTLADFQKEAEKHKPKDRPPGRYTVMVDFTADW